MKEVLAKVYYDINNDVSSVSFEGEIIRCKVCQSALHAETDFVKYCSIWNKIVPNQGFCYLGNEVKHNEN